MRSEDDEEKIVTLQLLIQVHGSDLCRKIVGNHSSKTNTAYVKQGPDQSCKDVLFCFATV